MLTVVTRMTLFSAAAVLVGWRAGGGGVVTDVPGCPPMCSCSEPGGDKTLSIDCSQLPAAAAAAASAANLKDVNATAGLDDILANIPRDLLSLKIAQADLNEIPESICRLTLLDRLRLDQNRLLQLPTGCLSNMTRLEEFSASANLIDGPLDGVFAGLVRLKSIRLSSNRIAHLGARPFAGLASLEELDLSRNLIARLDNGLLGGLTNLRRLDVSHSKLAWIDPLLFANESELRSLTTIDLSHNSIVVLDAWPFARGVAAGRSDFDRVDIRLGYNCIAEFRNEARLPLGCRHQRYSYADVDLSANHIRHITDIVTGYNLTFVDALCVLRKVERSGFDRPAFNVIVKNNQRLWCDCVDYNWYRLMSANDRNTMLSNSFCAGPPEMAKRQLPRIPLDQFVCNVNDSCPPNCSCIYRPATGTMHVRCPHLPGELPTELPELSKSYDVYSLEFAGSNLTAEGVRERAYFARTKTANLSDAGIGRIDPESWVSLTGEESSLTELVLTGNRLTTLPQEAAWTTVNVSSSSSSVSAVFDGDLRIHMKGNPWSCHCTELWQVRWMRHYHARVVDIDAVLCAAPVGLRNKKIASLTDDEVCPSTSRLSFVVAAVCVGVVVVVVGLAVLCRRSSRHRRGCCRNKPFDDDGALLVDSSNDCGGDNDDGRSIFDEAYQYDAFVCCSSSDHVTHGRNLLEMLEQNGYRVCYHLRDFVAGVYILRNIVDSILSSRRTICLLTENFIKR